MQGLLRIYSQYILRLKGSIIYQQLANLVFTAPTGDRGQLMFQIKLESDEIQFCPTWIVSHHNILHYNIS